MSRAAQPAPPQPRAERLPARPAATITPWGSSGGSTYVNDEFRWGEVIISTNFDSEGSKSCTLRLSVPAGVFRVIVNARVGQNGDPTNAEPPFNWSLSVDSTRDGHLMGHQGVQNYLAPQVGFNKVYDIEDPRPGTEIVATVNASGAKRFTIATVSFEVHYWPVLQVTVVPSDFRPFAAQDPAAPCYGVRGQSNGCYAVLTATKIPAVLGDDGGLDRIFFLLEQTTKLKGYSTNACWNDTCSDPKDTGADYQFVLADQSTAGWSPPTNQGQRMGTVSTPSSATAVVTSFDYGGKAVLRPVVTDNPDNPQYMIAADFVDQQGKRLKKQTLTLPADADGNGIADFWEKPHANQLGLGDFFPDPSLDTDLGMDGPLTPARLRGDGYSVHDEYRGFHVLQPGRKWISTDPAKQNLFYTDPDQIVLGHLHTIFGAVTSSFISLHEVDKADANLTPNDLMGDLGVLPLNRNGLFPNAEGFALIFRNRALGGGDIGRSAPRPEDGFTNNGKPIEIDRAKIASIAQLIAPHNGMPEPVLLAQVLAHETGHKLGIGHTMRGASNVPYSSNVNQLTTTTFMRGPDMKNQLFTRFLVYNLGTTARMDEKPFNLVLFKYKRLVPASGVASPPDTAYKILCEDSATTIATPANIGILDQDGTLMNWTPKLSQVNPVDWNFRAGERNRLCLKPGGCK